MPRLSGVRALTLIVVAALSAPSMAAEETPKIYACTIPGGDTVYQDEPCLAPEPVPPAPAPKSKPKAAAKPKPASKAKPKPEPAANSIKFVVPKTGRPELPSLTLPISNRSVDARWQTPDTTLKAFVSAIEAGDRSAIVSCLTASALADWGPEPGALPLDELRKTVDSFTGYVAEGDLGPYWSIRALRTGMRPKWIFFERTGDGEWKIGAL